MGSLLQLCTLRRLQLAGHRPIALAGGGTGMIGDPGGKTEERTLLSPDGAGRQPGGHPAPARAVPRLLDAARGGPGPAPRQRATGSARSRVVDFLRDVGKHFTVNQMVAKESVRARFERPDQGISYTEFSYMLLQAYDFLRLHLDHGCDLQIGGQRPVGQHHHGGRAHPQGGPGRGLRAHHPAGDQGRRHQVRQDRVGDGLAGRRP